MRSKGSREPARSEVVMYVKQFLHDARGCSSYFIASRTSREAVVVDAQYDIDPYLELAHERHYRITHVVDTHLHADHVSGNRHLAARAGATLCLHESADVEFPFEPLRDGQVLQIGHVELRVLHTPGHRPESISLMVANPARSPEASMVLTGDTLFVGDVGRPDFGGPDGAREEWESVQRLLELPDWVEVLPAHFEGSCGKSMCGRPTSTIGFERRFNPLLGLSRDEFVQLASQAPARPLNMAAIMATNEGRADMAWAQDVPEIPLQRVLVADAETWISEHDGLVVDVREPGEYAAGHLPGALSIPQAELATRLSEVPRDRDLLLVCASGGRSRRAARFLAGLGFERVADLLGGTSAWASAGRPLSHATS